MSGRPPPPVLARLLVRVVVPREDREFVLGDLEEDWREAVRERGRVRASTRYWSHALRTGVTYARHRVRARLRGAPPGPGRSGRPLDELQQDLAHGVRVLARSPGVSTLAVVTLAVGIGATTTALGLADALLVRPPAGVAGSEALAQVRFRAPHLEDDETGVSYRNVRDLEAARLPAVRSLVGWQRHVFQASVAGGPARTVTGAAVMGDYFGALGVTPASGRLLMASETGIGDAPAMVVLSRRGAEELFGEAERALGRTLELDAISFRVVGVAGAGFRGATRGGDSDLWIPFGMYPRVRRIPGEALAGRDRGSLHDVAVRMAPGASLEEAESQLRGAMGRLVEAFPEANARYEDYVPTLFRQVGLHPSTVERLKTTLFVVTAGALLVLLASCANVANLLIFRGLRREGESAVRQALGASRGRLLRQHLTESALLAAGGALLGMLLALLAQSLLSGAALPGAPPFEASGLDRRFVALALGAGAGTVLLAGLLPSVIVHRINMVRALKQSAPTATARRQGARNTLTALQLGLSIGLLGAALLLVRTHHNLRSVPLGFEPERVVEARLDPEPRGYDEAAGNAFQRELLDALGDAPAIEAAAAAAAGPLRAHLSTDLRRADDATEDWPVEAREDAVSPGYFDALGLRLVRGRTFSPEEMDAGWARRSDAAVVNETLARRLFGADDPVGRSALARGYRANTRLVVVGVVEDSRVRELDGPAEPALYRPLGEFWSNEVTVVARPARSPEEALVGLRAAVDRVDPRLPFYWSGTLSGRVAELTAEERLLSGLISVLALIAAILAGVGLYGLVAYTVAERHRDIGIRVAVGARRTELARWVLRQSLRAVAGGTALGLVTGWALTRVLQDRLYGVATLDPLSWSIAALGLILLVGAATLAPIRSALRVDPMEVIRTS